MGISSHLWWLETAMIELLKVEVSKSFPVVVAAWLDGNWQRCVDSFDAVLLDCSIHRHYIASHFGLSSTLFPSTSPKCWHGSSTLFCLVIIVQDSHATGGRRGASCRLSKSVR
mmetsp:Transcript_11839/g.21532  ORF Transcript_11839/g.21532 Transcript_11839/m.21532 type:complete len:113 (+) Transcript_11839:354-692(+)